MNTNRASGTSGEKNRDADQNKLSKADMIVIATLWTPEILSNVVFAMADRFNKDVQDASDLKFTRKDGYVRPWENITVACLVCVVMVIAGYCGDYHGHRFSIFYVGFCVFSVTPIIGIVCLLTNEVPSLLWWMRIFWYLAVPGRFWLIFHQKFPLPITVTHKIVSVNECLIEFTSWMSAVFIRQETVFAKFERSAYLTLWIIVNFAFIGYSLRIYLIRNSLNRHPSDIGSIRQRYQQYGQVASFDHRQTTTNVVVFLLLLYMVGMIAIVKEFLDSSITAMVNKVYYSTFGGIVRYRLDLIVSIITLTVVEAILSASKTFRHEVTNLIIIGVAHIVSIMVLVLLLITLVKSENAVLEEENQRVGTLEIFHEPSYHPFLLDCDNHPIESARLTVNGYTFLVESQRDVRCRGWKDSEELFDQVVTIYENRRSVFLLRKPNLVPIDSFKTWHPVPLTNVVFMNAIEDCDDDDESTTISKAPKLNLSSECTANPVCADIQLKMTARSNSNEILRFKEIEFPRFSRTTDFIELPRLTGKLELQFKRTIAEMKQLFNVTEGKFAHDNYWPVNVTVNIDPEPSIIVFLYFVDSRYFCLPVGIPNYLKKYYPDEALIAPLILLGVVIGTSAVGYVHFMWMESPIRCKTFIIATFFMENFLFAWLSKTYIQPSPIAAKCLLAAQCVIASAHIIFSFVFYRRLVTADLPRMSETS